MRKWEERELDELLKRYAVPLRRKLIVLDDDPTGVQTVHGIRVITAVDERLLEQAFVSRENLFYILTNSRGGSEAEASRLNRRIAAMLLSLSAKTGMPFTLISRGDSTLRGHYPLEIDALVAELAPTLEIDGHFLIPAFFEGGRITSGNVHYLLENGRRIPVDRTEFARDPVFGFRHADLRKYIEEKSNGRIPAADVLCVSLEDLREGGPDRVYEIISGMKNGRVGIVNAETYADLKIFAAGVLRAEASGKRLLFRSAASFVKALGGIPDKAPLERDELVGKERKNGGIVIVGSHVAKSTVQLQHLFASRPSIRPVELSVPELLREETRERELSNASRRIHAALAEGTHVAVYTSRALVQGGTETEHLSIGRSVSSALIELVRRLAVEPRFIVSKGGITSSDIATEGLGIRSAVVLGQAAKGVSVWACGPESKFPGLPYIVFPGNVGTEETLTEVVSKCMNDGEDGVAKV